MLATDRSMFSSTRTKAHELAGKRVIKSHERMLIEGDEQRMPTATRTTLVSVQGLPLQTIFAIPKFRRITYTSAYAHRPPSNVWQDTCRVKGGTTTTRR
jgi:hypothetical protein